MGVRVPPFARLRSPERASALQARGLARASFVNASRAKQLGHAPIIPCSGEQATCRAVAPEARRRMKTEFVDVNETRKNVRVEIPTDVVNAEIDRIARDYSRKARVPGFRPGKAPASVIKQRYKDQILHDVAHDLIPRAVDDALRERGVEP